MKDYRHNLFHQTPLKIFSFISRQPGKTFCEGEIRKFTKSSIGSTNQTLKLLLKLNIVIRETKGNVFLYSLNNDNYALRYFKIFENLLYLNDLIEELKPYSYSIILYGSCAQGTNTVDSDIDLYIKTEHKPEVRKVVNKYREIDDSIKAVILDPLEIASSKKEDEVFYNEVKKGITLWEGRPIHEKI